MIKSLHYMYGQRKWKTEEKKITSLELNSSIATTFIHSAFFKLMYKNHILFTFIFFWNEHVIQSNMSTIGILWERKNQKKIEKIN